jgi:hypothetical protein
MIVKILLLTATVLVLSFGCVYAQFDHSLYDTFLQEHVENGLVDYAGIKNDREPLDQYLKSIALLDAAEFATWPRDDRKAFWINAYNAITIEGIVRNYPIQYGGFLAKRRFPQNSIRQIGEFWDTVFIKVMGKDISLNDIEHKILRKEFDDPRIHFVLVCAAIGCPLLENRAFLPEGLNGRLKTAASDFILNEDKVRLDKENNRLYLSSILQWYKKDFPRTGNADAAYSKYGKNTRGMVEYVTAYMTGPDRAYVEKNRPEIKYLDYDWSLNEQK